MAPSTRKAASLRVSKPAARKQRPPRREPSDSWELLERQQPDPRGVDGDETQDAEEDGSEEEQLLIAPAAPADDPGEPLEEMVERVGKEVESFAETVDEFFDKLVADDTYDVMHDMVLRFKEIASDHVAELKKDHGREHREKLTKKWSDQVDVPTLPAEFKPSLSTHSDELSMAKSKQVRLLRDYQEEVDTWELFRIILELHYNPNMAAIHQERQDRLAKLGPVHRYTPESVLYDRFIIENDLARERSLIKTWLEQAAANQRSDLKGITEELESKAGTGPGLWSRGWMHTREKIKGEKRLRTWPEPDAPPLPQIRRTDTNELIVTSLDPDAVSRQKRTLEEQDVFFERAVWIACWEMLRRGTSWGDVADWCEARKEGWRAVAIGMCVPEAEAPSRAAWRKMCFLASQSEYSNDYEAAVYGFLGGNFKAMHRISATVDDELFAHYSAALVQQFDQHLLTSHPGRVPQALNKRAHWDEGVSDPDMAQKSIMELIFNLRKQAKTKSESVAPFKILQSYLLANESESLVHTLGVVISDADTLRGDAEGVVTRVREVTGGEKTWPEAEVVCDPMCLRIAAHISLVLQVLRNDALDQEELDMEDNVLVAYIQILRVVGKRDLTPVYASRLQTPRYVSTMARVLRDVTESREREEMISLMQQRGLDVKAILWRQLTDQLHTMVDCAPDKEPLRILERCDEDLYPGQRIILNGLPDAVTPEQEAVVQALEWYLQLPGHWDSTFTALTLAMRKCLLNGRFACARLIAETFPYDVVSQNKSYQVIGRSFNLMNNDSSRPGDAREAAQWDRMQRQSKAYFELEQLVKAFEVLDMWRSEEHMYTSNLPRPGSVPSSLKQTFDAVEADMVALIDGKGFLLDSHDEHEAADFARIREIYVTEAIVAYNTVLHSAGTLITRDSLLKSLDLATTVAKEETKLSGAFAAAGRMRELVSGFAQTSRAMLVLKNRGKQWKPKKDREGRDVAIWEIGPQGATAGDELSAVSVER